MTVPFDIQDPARRRPARALLPLAVSGALLLGLAAPAPAADLTGDARAVSQFCLTFIRTGQRSDLLLRHGFTQHGRKFRKAYRNGTLTRPRQSISVDSRTSRLGLTCGADFSGLARNEGHALYRAAQDVARKEGYRTEIRTNKNRRGRQTPVLVKGTIVVDLSGFARRSRGSTTTSFYFQRLD